MIWKCYSNEILLCIFLNILWFRMIFSCWAIVFLDFRFEFVNFVVSILFGFVRCIRILNDEKQKHTQILKDCVNHRRIVCSFLWILRKFFIFFMQLEWSDSFDVLKWPSVEIEFLFQYCLPFHEFSSCAQLINIANRCRLDSNLMYFILFFSYIKRFYITKWISWQSYSYSPRVLSLLFVHHVTSYSTYRVDSILSNTQKKGKNREN